MVDGGAAPEVIARAADLDHTVPFCPVQAEPDPAAQPEPVAGAVTTEVAPAAAPTALDPVGQESSGDVAPADDPAAGPGETLAAQCSGPSTLDTAVAVPVGHNSPEALPAVAAGHGHHRAKTFLGFSYRHLGRGVLEWTTPLGRAHRSYPRDYRPEDDGAGESDGDPPPAGSR